MIKREPPEGTRFCRFCGKPLGYWVNVAEKKKESRYVWRHRHTFFCPDPPESNEGCRQKYIEREADEAVEAVLNHKEEPIKYIAYDKCRACSRSCKQTRPEARGGEAELGLVFDCRDFTEAPC